MAGTLGSANIFPKVTFVEGAAPASPAASDFSLYFDSADHLLKWKNSAGTVVTIATGSSSMTNPMSAVGDIIQGTTAGAPAALAAPLAGKVLTGAGVTTSVVWAYPPGYEFAYVEITSAVTINVASPEASAVSVISAGAVTFDGSTRVKIEAWFPYVETPQTDADPISLLLFDGATSLGYVGRTYVDMSTATAADIVNGPTYISRFLTPSNASHTYSIRGLQASGSGTVQAGPGAAGNWNPGWIRITKA